MIAHCQINPTSPSQSCKISDAKSVTFDNPNNKYIYFVTPSISAREYLRTGNVETKTICAALVLKFKEEEQSGVISKPRMEYQESDQLWPRLNTLLTTQDHQELNSSQEEYQFILATK